MEKIESQKGKYLLLNDGFRYGKARVNSNGSYHGGVSRSTVKEASRYMITNQQLSLKTVIQLTLRRMKLPSQWRRCEDVLLKA